MLPLPLKFQLLVPRMPKLTTQLLSVITHQLTFPLLSSLTLLTNIFIAFISYSLTDTLTAFITYKSTDRLNCIHVFFIKMCWNVNTFWCLHLTLGTSNPFRSRIFSFDQSTTRKTFTSSSPTTSIVRTICTVHAIYSSCFRCIQHTSSDTFFLHFHLNDCCNFNFSLSTISSVSTADFQKRTHINCTYIHRTFFF